MSVAKTRKFPTTQLGGGAFNHSASLNTEREYDRLRNLARQEHDKRSACFAKAHQAYERGDGSSAHELSEEGKRLGAMMDQYNKQASDYIFRENNAVGRVDSDTIDLHGQFVEEAEDILEARIRYAQQHGQTHLHVIVGKGNHSVNHIQKIKPRVEQICQELGLQYATEENEGRMYVNLQGGPAVMPPTGGKHHHGGHQQQHLQGQYQGYQQPQDQQQYSQAGGQYQQQQQQQYGQAGGQYQQQQQGGGQGDEMEQAVKKLIPRILQKMEEKGCCVVM